MENKMCDLYSITIISFKIRLCKAHKSSNRLKIFALQHPSYTTLLYHYRGNFQKVFVCSLEQVKHELELDENDLHSVSSFDFTPFYSPF